jgi:hypothetical protein
MQGRACVVAPFVVHQPLKWTAFPVSVLIRAEIRFYPLVRMRCLHAGVQAARRRPNERPEQQQMKVAR